MDVGQLISRECLLGCFAATLCRSRCVDHVLTGLTCCASADSPQELAAVSALSASEGQQDPAVSPACYMVSSDLSAAPDLVTDSEMDAASSQQCTGANSMQATLVNGLGWMVEEAQEVTNFTESNFAAVG